MSKTTVKEAPVKCVVCNGSGKNPENKESPCVGCEGDGWLYTIETITESKDQVKIGDGIGQWVPIINPIPYTAPTTIEETCSNCWGGGKLYSHFPYYGGPWTDPLGYSICPLCGGSGKVKRFQYYQTLYGTATGQAGHYNVSNTNKIELK
jgi:DnaJ-class molecular chaperone